MATIKRYLANGITVLGGLMCFVLMWLVGWNRQIVPIFFLALFIGATDFFDGIVARRTGTITKFGSYADKLRDKFLEGNLIAFFIIDRRVDLWLSAIAIPLGITWVLLNGVWLAALIRRQEIKANQWGKRKMFIFSVVSLWYLACLAAQEKWALGMPRLIAGLVFAAFAVVLVCAVMSFIKNRAKYNHDLSSCL